jgi:hypothetical protein
MSYKIIKKVKGHYYLYLQESYRVGKSVKTRSQYLGKVDGSYSVGWQRRTPTNSIKTRLVINDKVVNEEPQRAKYTISHNRISMFSDKELPFKHLYLKITSKANLSHSALGTEYNAHLKRLSKKYNITEKPTITIKKGGTLGIKKNSKNSLDYTLKIPNEKGIRNKARQEYKKIFANIELDLMKNQNPNQYNELEESFKTSLKYSKKCLQTYVNNHDNYDDKLAYKIGLKMFSYANIVPKNKTGKGEIESQKLSLSSYGKMNWKDEFAYLKSQNLTKLKTQIQAELKSATVSKKRLEKKKVSIIRKSKLKRDIKRHDAQINLHNELLKRINIIESL